METIPKPNNFRSHNSLNLSFTNIWSFCSNFNGCKSFLELNPPDILALYETNVDDSTDSWMTHFSVCGCLSLTLNDSATYMRGLATYMKEKLPFFTRLAPWILNSNSNVFECFFFIQCLTSFLLIDHHPSFFMHSFWWLFHLT